MMNPRRYRRAVLTAFHVTGILSATSLNVSCSPSAREDAATPEASRPAETRQDHDERMAWWRDARFGMFIHWGLYAIPAGEWNGNTDHGEWIMNTAQIPVESYEDFTRQFNPTAFDASAWVRMAKAAGMRYIVITTKHHDGFCLFDSRFTDYDVMSTPFRRDIMKELSDACAREGIRMCWYHSIMDWHHPDYLPRRGWESRPAVGANFDRYVSHLHNQVRELLTNYGTIGVMWFDGEWETSWNHKYGQSLYDLCRSIQPDVIVNNRVDVGRSGMAGFTENPAFAGDFGTPEQEIPATGLPGVDWETCMTMNDHWGYNRHDPDWKTVQDLIRKLCDIASKGGNFLLNVGPTASGEFPPQAIDRLNGLGRWMATYGESIHGTTAGPFDSLPWGRCTMRVQGGDTVLYLHVFDWPAHGRLIVPGLGNEVKNVSVLGTSEPVTARRVHSDIVLALRTVAPNQDCSVIALTIDGAPIVYRPPVIAAPADIFVRPITIAMSTSSPDLQIRYTTDGSDPNASSSLYTAPITLDRNTHLTARTFHNDKPVSDATSREFRAVKPRHAVLPLASSPGLALATYSGNFDALPNFELLNTESTGVAPAVTLASNERGEYVARRYTGFIAVSNDDVYTFALTSDDGSRLRIHDEVVIDNDGLHGVEEVQGVIALAKGFHPIVIEYFNKTGGAELSLRMAPLGQPLQSVAPAMLTH